MPTTSSEPEACADLGTWLRHGTQQLQERAVPSPRADAETLLAFVLDIERGELLRRVILTEPMLPEQSQAYEHLIDERSRRVPLQHLTGYADFAGLQLRVGPGVFVPRFETELMVEKVGAILGEMSDIEVPLVVDLCTGSAAIALALKKRAPSALVHAVEVDPQAHAWAVLNQTQAGLDIDLHLADACHALAHLDGTVDVVTCNPPYVPIGAVPNEPEVREHDPEVALYGGSTDGLAIPRHMFARAAGLLRSGGVLAMEHAESQGETMVTELGAAGCWSQVWDEPDLSGRPRTTYAVRGPR